MLIASIAGYAANRGKSIPLSMNRILIIPISGYICETKQKDMRKNFGVKTWTYPQPVLMIATYNEDGTPDIMNAAWGGISDSDEISIAVSGTHKTAENLRRRGAFTVSFATAGQVAACDYVGLVSGNKVPDKFARAGFHVVKSEFVDAPLVEELPMALECKVRSYDPETDILKGEIVNVCADESILTDGKIDPAKLRPIVYDPANHDYLEIGAKVVNAFSDGNRLK